MTRYLARNPKRTRPEPTVALINVVFLLLVFFLVAGSLSRPVQGDIALINFDEPNDPLPQDVVSLYADGRILQAGEAQNIENLRPEDDTDTTIRLAPDRELDAQRFARLVLSLRKQGWENIILFGEKATLP